MKRVGVGDREGRVLLFVWCIVLFLDWLVEGGFFEDFGNFFFIWFYVVEFSNF